ncbi:beta-galactosidase [Clostridium tertium]|jgi:beta-galactosidase|uniref:beta-galactosidase n=1 Tax=Clostridium tertium TaxID=1559 RepID=UPI000BE2E95F|nr:beta-galactosidase [Clostridium tertium]MDB1940529.1 beta-galactosidase [Clostridium tertium]
MENIFNKFLHGADYNPEQWLDYPDIFEKDIELMKKAHCNVMSIGIFSWAALEPEEGVFNFEWLDKVINTLYENGINTILATPSGARPAWLSQKYPEVLRVAENRVRNLHGFRHNHCYTSPIYREKTAILNGKLAERYANNPAVIMWHISNEYGGECHCELCQEEFRKWLKEKYKTLDNLNKKWWTTFWSHTFTSWDQIESPSPIGENQVHALNLDWKRFVTDRTIDFMRHEIDTVKKYNSSIPATTNFMYYYEGLNYFKFKDYVDVVSYDSYPEWHSESNIESAYKVAAYFDIMRSIKGKPFMLMESTPSMTNWQRVSKLKRPGMHKLASIQAVAHGSNTVQYFQWRKSRGSSEKLHGAVVDHYGKEDTRVFNDVAEVGITLEKINDVINSKVESKVAIVFDWENMWALKDSQGPRNIGLNYIDIVTEYYKVFWELGINVDFVDMEGNIDKYDLVIAPILYMTRSEYQDKIRAFVEKGGNFVMTYWSSIVNDVDLCYLGGFPGKLMDVFGLRSEEVDALYDYEVNEIRVKKDNKIYKCTHICDLIHASEAEVLAEYNSDFYKGMPALTKNSYGNGNAYYIASRMDGEFNKDFLSKLISNIGIKRNLGVELPFGVTITKREDDLNEYLFIQNYSDEKREINLEEYCLKDIINNNKISNKILLNPYDVVICEKEK